MELILIFTKKEIWNLDGEEILKTVILAGVGQPLVFDVVGIEMDLRKYDK